MYETEEDLAELQGLLDRTYESAGRHLRSILSENLRLSAAEVCGLLPGVQIINLATVTRGFEPRVAPVDGQFFRGHFYFGSSPDSFRFRHIAYRPQVSASHTRGEKLAILVHGTAERIDMTAPDMQGFRKYLVEIYGGDWADWGSGAAYARIDAAKMFASRLPGG
jgi:uncharacterized pyridoxamine 5'-phosphate oxidase family protein